MNQIVEVVWDDATFCDRAFTRKKAIKKNTLTRVVSVGFLVAETEEGVVIAQSTDVDEPWNEGDVSEVLIVPWGMLVEWSDIG